MEPTISNGRRLVLRYSPRITEADLNFQTWMDDRLMSIYRRQDGLWTRFRRFLFGSRGSRQAEVPAINFGGSMHRTVVSHGRGRRSNRSVRINQGRSGLPCSGDWWPRRTISR